MGVILPKPVLSKVIERVGDFRVWGGSCCINGYRNTMEDSHCMVVSGDRMIFGVFDGHSNEKCSDYISQHLPRRLLAQPLPISDATLEKICLDIDEQFLEDIGEGGTTATFCIVEGTDQRGYNVTVCNVGDSRTLLVRNDEVLFSTVDHKPLNLAERQRIERCGGAVRMNRVDGDLAVSRAFGDGAFKRNRNDPRNQKVVAVPDVTRLVCQPGDVLIIACDGVFEGSFNNEEVAQFVQKELNNPAPVDIGIVPARVCDQAVRRGSKDNVSCMVIQFTNGVDLVKIFGERDFVPSAPYPKAHDASRCAYARMANLAGLTIGEALEMRYQLLQAYLSGNLTKLPPIKQIAFEMSDEVDLETEKGFFGAGPTPGTEKSWFQSLADPYAFGDH